VSDVRRHIDALGDDTKAYAKSMSSSVNFLIEENERMNRELQAARQREEKSIGSTRVEMKKAIHAEYRLLR